MGTGGQGTVYWKWDGNQLMHSTKQQSLILPFYFADKCLSYYDLFVNNLPFVVVYRFYRQLPSWIAGYV